MAGTVDIQYIYIVEMLPENKRASVRGITGAVATLAAMLIPVFRKLFTASGSGGWRHIYLPAIYFEICVIVSVLLLCRKTWNHKTYEKSPSDHTALTENRTLGEGFRNLKTNIKELKYLLLYLIYGTATAGITLYNEPYAVFSGAGDREMYIILLVSPAAILVITIAGGFIGDYFSRRKMIVAGSIGACLALASYVYVCYRGVSPVLTGVLWGSMVGLYFNGEAVFHMMILENAGETPLGKLSAVSTCAYGLGDGIGMLLTGLLVKYTGMGAAKLIMSVPAMALVGLILVLEPKYGIGYSSEHQTGIDDVRQ
jgi:MFS family permease